MSVFKKSKSKALGFGLHELLTAFDAHPVLMDIGAAGASPAAWLALAPASTLVGFEPDTRNPDPTFGRGFANALLVDKVVVADHEADTARLILTEYPSCSSLLEADLTALSSFVFRDYFRPVDVQTVPAICLDRVFATHGFAGAHWLKVDSQGLDKRLLASIAPRHFSQLLAVDIEPGFIDAYIGEDLYPECHAWLKDNHFWLAELKQQSYAKMRPETADGLVRCGFDMDTLLLKLRKSPTAAEALYFREVTWMFNEVQDPKLWVMQFVFAASQRFYGYCADIVFSHQEKFGENELGTRMHKSLISMLRANL